MVKNRGVRVARWLPTRSMARTQVPIGHSICRSEVRAV
jgi:hypothetical protein